MTNSKSAWSIPSIMVCMMIFTLGAAASPALAEYHDHGNGTVTDSSTGLMWETSDDGVTRDWEDALAHCQACTAGGHTDWRLPNVKELLSLVDHGRIDPTINPVFDCHSSDYWSSSPSAGGSGYAWYVNFFYGYASYYYKSDKKFVRCVRAGQ